MLSPPSSGQQRHPRAQGVTSGPGSCASTTCPPALRNFPAHLGLIACDFHFAIFRRCTGAGCARAALLQSIRSLVQW